MLELWITDLKSKEKAFDVPGSVGSWEFQQREDYLEILQKIQEGQCAPTYYAANAAVDHSISDADFIAATDELIDSCLILSFLSGACVTPRGSTQASTLQFAQLGDAFIRPRAIAGVDPLLISGSYGQYFSKGMPAIRAAMLPRRLRLFLSHWISGLTCFSLEDLFLSLGVQMDIVKQCEIAAAGTKIDYFPGMQAASARYGLTPLTRDYKDMRNDIVHEGRLSGTNFPSKTKAQCASVIVDTLNWIDLYVCAVLGLGTPPARWRLHDLQHGLPALSLAQ
ncbi:MAG: hypothetical protein O9274_02180 [Limnobacter sp.]|uniref:hypothetical protein n=1 Tax=Limnobacter sp. TaxID=2003368 RepID=UPI0022C378DC|nr:hypothetical protein [Limnobacter sp.]MCZ8014483.1 hypothetical protein [Limnobacter sp.]